MFQSPRKDIEVVRLLIHYLRWPSGEWWIWFGSCVLLMAMVIWQGGFIANALLRLAVIGGGFRAIAGGEKRRRADPDPPDIVMSWGCAVPLVLLLMAFLFVFFGWIWMTFDLE